MKQPSPINNQCTPEKKVKFMEMNAELRDLKSAEALADYEHCKGTLPKWEWEKLKETIKDRFQKVLDERNNIYN